MGGEIIPYMICIHIIQLNYLKRTRFTMWSGFHKMSQSVIKFYKKKEPYYEFSNFYGKTDSKALKLPLNGFEWVSTEQYFQAMKFYIPGSQEHMEYYRLIQAADTPMKVFALARQKKLGGYQAKWNVNNKTMKETLVNEVIDRYKNLEMRADWECIKVEVMRDALRAKFKRENNPKLYEMLRSTGDAYIVEDSPRDAYWGIGRDGKGENMLGKLLMEVRKESQLSRG